MNTKATLTMIVLAGLIASSGFAQARNFRHEHIIATMGFEGDGSAITNIDPANVQGTALVSAAIGSTVQAYSANLDKLALNDGSSLTNLPAATSMSAANLIAGTVASAIDGSAITNLTLGVGSVVQAYSANLDKLALNNGSSLTNLPAGTGGTVGGHLLQIWNGPTCDTYNVDATGVYTTWMGSTFP